MLAIIAILTALLALIIIELKWRELALRLCRSERQQQQLQQALAQAAKQHRATLASVLQQNQHPVNTQSPCRKPALTAANGATSARRSTAPTAAPPLTTAALQRSLRTLGFATLPNRQQLKQRMRRLARQHHPDHGGDSNTMIRINRAYQQLSHRQQR
ncbi:J domain-containing protein [uncultured Ferrimonas sp.]|uniref:J domain-containing protein n=1 Tax=uncultured Ferrimonas sp. TaxID=432640 RepID=UPI0026233EAD|nr:J domain-containing protein [uncultured Ferrimonas sp.]